MSNEFVKEVAVSQKCLVVAPAGCGKTHLISEAVKYCSGRQLILTHTHAGVKAIRDKMTQLGVPKDRYRVTTIDAFALRYAAAYSTISNWTIQRPENDQWIQLRPAAIKVFRANIFERIFKASYTGVFVDEYQDCTAGQHNIVLELASILPCRIFGDYLQAIFWEINRKTGEALDWADVEKQFPLLGELKEPHRWINKNGEIGKNEDLGRWLLEIRKKLTNGEEIDLRDAPGIDIELCEPDIARQISLIQPLCSTTDSYIALMKSREACYQLARKLQNADFSTFEDAYCAELMKWARRIEDSTGIERIQRLKGFVLNWLACPPKDLSSVFDSVINLKKCGTELSPEMISLHNSLAKVRDENDGYAVYQALNIIDSLRPEVVRISSEIWEGLRQAASHGGALYQAAWDHREKIRQKGRQPSKHSLSTPLLIKGLEFDGCLILNAADFPTAESLYVCLTRASKKVYILSKSTKIKVIRAANATVSQNI